MIAQQTSPAAVAAPTQTPSRRGMLGKLALAGGAIAALGLFNPTESRAAASLTFADIPGSGDVKVLNYALLLEQLETVLYRKAAQRLLDGGDDGFGHKFAGLKVNPSSRAVRYVTAFAEVERDHRNFIHDALGGASILNVPKFRNARFQFNIGDLDAAEVLNLVYVAERTGVGAYLGAITKFATKSYLQLAGAIQGTEARHTAAIAQTINLEYGGALNVAPLYNDNNGIDKAVDPNTVLAGVGPFIVLG